MTYQQPLPASRWVIFLLAVSSKHVSYLSLLLIPLLTFLYFFFCLFKRFQMPSLFSSYICSPYSFDFKASAMALGTLSLHLLVPLFQRSRRGLTNSFGIPFLKFANTFIDFIITSAYTLFQNILRACECLQRFVPSSPLPTGQRWRTWLLVYKRPCFFFIRAHLFILI